MSRKKATLSKHGETSTAPSTNNDSDARPRRQQRERLPSSVLAELWSIWRADPRVPSVKSRRSWAISRNANPRSVDSWFLRRRTCAKKAGQSVPDGSYNLPLDPPIVPKRELSTTSIEPEVESVFDPPSDDTLALVYPPYTDELNDMEASSDTVFEDASVELKRIETPAYKDVREQPCIEHQHPQPELWQSSADFDVAQDRCNEDVPSLQIPFFPVCNQGQGKQSDFTCILCSTKPIQDEVVSDFDATSDARGNVFVPCPRLDFNPDTLSELSAIPFLFRTPRTVLRDDAVNHRTVDNWTIVENELGRLVNDGRLDLSFLDVPHLASMELLD